jgi:tRNA (cmo5U34)-methyltransferase
MSVASHLGIDLADYDERIRAFIPNYDAMLDAAAAAVPAHARTILDLGTGTGALAARCLARLPAARIVGVDEDAGMLDAARHRLGSRATLLHNSFARAALPRCDAIVTSLALHHIRTKAAKAALYRRLRAALRPKGMLIAADCHPAAAAAIAKQQRQEWVAHLRESHSARAADALFTAWAKEDVYVPLSAEIELLQRGGFATDLIWRHGSFAVVAAWPRSASARPTVAAKPRRK